MSGMSCTPGVIETSPALRGLSERGRGGREREIEDIPKTTGSQSTSLVILATVISSLPYAAV